METNPNTCEDQPKNYTSCQYLAMIDSEIIEQETFADEEKASAAAMRSQVRGVIVIGKNFSSAFEDKILKENDEPILDGDIKVAIYETDMQTKFVVHDALLYAVNQLLEEMRAEYGNKVDRADSLIQITGPVHSDRNITHTYFMAPGLVICFTFYQAAATLALSLIRERIAQRMVRNYVAGAANVEIVTSHIITYIPLILAHMGLLLVGLFFILNVPLRGQVIEVINLMLMQGISGIAFGHVISYFCGTELQGMKIILSACFLSMLFCGIVWPITVMPHWLQTTVSAFPQTDASSELRKALTCGSIYKIGLFQGLIVPAIWTVLLFAISSVLHIL
ncbi:ABC transporter G family member 20 [Anabrus simplex]|uniref:ABC transporter G family member 20 n=1 Tax=Anabrus simplex TaxID=316456 RepID=UPI0035A39F84